VVEIVGIRNDGIEAVVAAGHFDHDQDVVFTGAAACAVRATNCGTTPLRATSDEACNVRSGIDDG